MLHRDLPKPTRSSSSNADGCFIPGSGRNARAAFSDGTGTSPEIWVKQQRPYISKRVLSSWFGGIPMNRIQVHCPYQGASFGGWSQVPWNMGGHYCAGLLARRTGRPVKWIFTRREDFYGGEMDEGSYRYKVGAKKDGTITAVEISSCTVQPLVPCFRHGHSLPGKHENSQHLRETESGPDQQGHQCAHPLRAEYQRDESDPCV